MVSWAIIRFGAGATAAVLGLVGCGGSSRIPEAVSQTPVTATTITVHQTGNAQAMIDQNSVSFGLDAAGLLVIRASLRSTASANQTIITRASVFDPSGAQVGDATGGKTAVAPGATAMVQLNGPTPHGTIASAIFELTQQASPTSPAPPA